MAGALRVLSSVQPRLLHHAGASSHPQSTTGLFVGLPSDRGVIVTSILHSDIGFDNEPHLLQDIGKCGCHLHASLPCPVDCCLQKKQAACYLLASA